jgi:hypothetical protein
MKTKLGTVWIVGDDDGEVFLYRRKPVRYRYNKSQYHSVGNSGFVYLPKLKNKIKEPIECVLVPVEEYRDLCDKSEVSNDSNNN